MAWIRIGLSGVWLIFFFVGCAEITPPTPQEVLESPFGTGPLRVGMTKDEVREIWGEPDYMEAQGEDEWGEKRELWTYEAKFPGLIPADVGYASRTKRLEFAGEILVVIHD